VFDGGPLFPLVAMAVLFPFFLLPTVIGSVLTLVLVNVFPARRARDLLSLLAIASGGALVLFLRLLRPEQLARPEGYQNLMQFIALLRAPSHPLLPSEWASSALMNWLLRIGDPLPVILLWTTAGAFIVIGASLHRRLYMPGFTKSQEGANSGTSRAVWQRVGSRLLGWMSVTKREFVLKDLRVFFRDATQVESAHSAGGVAAGVHLQYPLPAAVQRGKGALRAGHPGRFPQPGLAGSSFRPSRRGSSFRRSLSRGGSSGCSDRVPLDLRAMLWSKYWVGTLPSWCSRWSSAS
jgi:ABC-2 type transport system permease protein